LKVDEGKVKQLIVNGLDVPEKDIPNFSNLTEKILRKATPPTSTPTTPSVPSDIFNQEGFQLGQNGFKFKDKDTDFKLDENGLFLNGVDENGKPIYLKIDKNGMQLNDLESTLNMANEDNYAQDARPVEGTKQYNKKGQLEYIAGDDGSVRYYNEKGELTNYYLPNGDMKQYRNKKLVGIQKESNSTNKNKAKINNAPSTQKDAYNTLRFKADNGYSYVVFDLNGEKIWKCYQNDQFLGDLVMKNNKPIINGKTPSGGELLKLGLLYYNNALNPQTGGFQIITVEKHGGCEECPQNAQNYSFHSDSDDDDENDDLQADIQELKSNVRALRNDIKSCSSTENFDFRLGLMEELDRIFPAYKSQNRKVFNAFEKRFLDIKNRWEKSECEGNNITDDVEKARQNAIKLRQNAARQNLQESRNKAEMNREKAQAERDRRTAMEDRKTALEDAKQARNHENDGDKGDIAKRSIFVNLKKLGLISVNKKCTLTMDKKHIEVDGKTLDNATFKRIYNEFEKKLGKKATHFSMFYKGVFTEISAENVEMTGTTTSSLSTDD
jgi:hypothetical protein